MDKDQIPEAEDKFEINIGEIKAEKGSIVNIAGGNIIQKIINIVFGDSEQQRAYRYRQNMLQLVWNTWIEGYLKKSLHNEVLIELGMETKPDAVDHPWDMIVQMPDGESKLVPAGTTMLELFDQVNGSLLILGEPGSGKTTMLLELCRLTIERATEDPLQPIPVVFNLSSWKPDPKKKFGQTFAEWLVSELKGKYSVPNKIGYSWIENDILLLLLDGLNEVGEENSGKCIEAINGFRAEHNMQIAVCSRKQEYEALTVQIHMRGAINIQPLTRQEVEEFLKTTDVGFDNVYQVIQRDSELREFAHTPLILSILILTYKNAVDANLEVLTSTGNFRKTLFDVYISQMFKRHSAHQPFTSERASEWLSWLAERMVENKQTIFMIEEIQPSWLPSSRRMPNIIIGLVFGLIIGLSNGLVAGLSKGWVEGLIIGLIAGLSYGLIFGLFVGSDDVKPTGKLIWSWKEARRGLKFGLIVGPILGLVFGLIWGQNKELIVGLIFWLIIGLFSVLIFGLGSITINEQSKPEDGIKSSMKNITMICLIFLMSGGLFFMLVGGRVIFGLCAGLILGLVLGIRFGLVFLINHFFSRWLLHHSGYLPWHIKDFTEYATERIFLRQVGGGYIFIHSMLMEHFAEMWDEKYSKEKI